MIEALQLEFMRNALLAGFLASIMCGIIGTLVVVNRIVFLSGGIAHAAYGGIGLAYFFGWPYMVGTIGFSLTASMAMAAVTVKARHRADTIIGVLWAVGMALGVILIDMTPVDGPAQWWLYSAAHSMVRFMFINAWTGTGKGWDLLP